MWTNSFSGLCDLSNVCGDGIICLSYIINTEGLEVSMWRYGFENLSGQVGFQT